MVTQNVWGVRGAWPHRRALLEQGIGDLEPDIVSFQEVIRTGEYAMVEDLLGPQYQVVYQREPEPDGQSAAIATRWPVLDIHEIDQHLSARINSASTTLVVEIAAPEPIGDVIVVNHLPCWQLPFEWEREQQAKRAAEFVEKMLDGRERHVIVAGDLTDPPESASVRFWTGRQSIDGYSVCYRDAWESVHGDQAGDTYIPDNPILADPDWPFRRLDYILVRCGLHGGPTLAIERCERLFDKAVNGVWASDHFGVMADLGLPQRPAPPPPNLPAD